MKYLVTGAAGFIGYHVSERLLAAGHEVVGLDNLNPYYDPALKQARLNRLRRHRQFHFEFAELADRDGIEGIFSAGKFNRVIHLAAQAGVRYAVTHPHSYIDSNVVGFLHVLEGCRHFGVEHLVYASTSSVYGLNTSMPFSTHAGVDHPVSLYAATKKANELMAHSYAHLYQVPTTGLRFFTVYGPWGRPDMALFLFCKAILEDRPIEVFNHGRMSRDFTYVDDVVEGVVRVADQPPTADPAWDAMTADAATSSAPYRLYNIGNSRPSPLMDFIAALETSLGKTAEKHFVAMQPGDVPATAADVADLARDTGFRPDTSIQVGVERFVQWYLGYYHPTIASVAAAPAAGGVGSA